MPNIGSLHPYIVHGVIGFLLAGVLLRLISLTGRWSWSNQAAALLLVVGAGTAVVAVKSGTDAHGPVERIPGARTAVVDHEEWGERTRNLFLAVAVLELAALGIPSRQRAIRFVTAALGVVGAAFIYETGEHGGDLVYSYGGGPGLRSGDPQDVQRLLLAGLYNQAMQDRRESRPADAVILIGEMARRWPDNLEIRMLRAESLWRDSHAPASALAAMDSITPSPDDARLKRNLAFMRAHALMETGHADSARRIVEKVIQEGPPTAITRFKALLDSIK